MTVTKQASLPVGSQEDVVTTRQAIRKWAVELGFSLLDQTKLVTAASELARNTVIYGGGGFMLVEALEDAGRRGLRLTFQDRGPGIADIPQALQDGYTSGSGMGLGLGGSQRLSDEFSIESEVGRGTRVSIMRWKR